MRVPVAGGRGSGWLYSAPRSAQMSTMWRGKRSTTTPCWVIRIATGPLLTETSGKPGTPNIKLRPVAANRKSPLGLQAPGSHRWTGCVDEGAPSVRGVRDPELEGARHLDQGGPVGKRAGAEVLSGCQRVNIDRPRRAAHPEVSGVPRVLPAAASGRRHRRGEGKESENHHGPNNEAAPLHEKITPLAGASPHLRHLCSPPRSRSQ